LTSESHGPQANFRYHQPLCSLQVKLSMKHNITSFLNNTIARYEKLNSYIIQIKCFGDIGASHYTQWAFKVSGFRFRVSGKVSET
jgi:hypothetical protein